MDVDHQRLKILNVAHNFKNVGDPCSRRPKERLHLNLHLISYLMTCACETWSTNEEDEEIMPWFERRVFRRIYGPILKNERYRRKTNREIQLIY